MAFYTASKMNDFLFSVKVYKRGMSRSLRDDAQDRSAEKSQRKLKALPVAMTC